jgi:hypothetical protein
VSQSSEASITQRHGAQLLPPAPISRRPALKIKGAPSGDASLPRVPRRGYLLRPITHQGNLGKGKAVNGWSGSSQSARKNTATVSAEPITNSAVSSLS